MSLKSFLHDIGYKSKGLREFSDKMPDAPVKIKLKGHASGVLVWSDLPVTTSMPYEVHYQQMRNL